MSKRLTVFLLMLLGVVLLLAQTTRSEIKLTATKVELSGEVKLAWTKPLDADKSTQYELYRIKLPDTTAALIHTTLDTFFVDKILQVVSTTPQYFAYYVLAKTGTVTVKSNIINVPLPGVPIAGAFKLEGKIDSGKVKLFWQVPPINTPVEYYLVYGMPVWMSALVQIDSTTNQFSITKIPAVVPGTKLEFNYFVRAKLSSGEFLQSTSVQLTIENRIPHDDIKFVSSPNLHGQIGVKYNYTAKAVSSDPTAVIRYSGWASPGMLTVVVPINIDSITGVVDWTPKEKGYYNVVIYAKSNKGGIAKQYFTVVVSGGNGFIQGKVTDTLATPVPNVLIEVFNTENNNTLSFAYSARTDNNGNYHIARVELGKYKIKANAPSGKYQSQWYEGKRDASQADIVPVDDSAKVGPTLVNFKLRGGIFTVPKITVKGTVTDTTGLAINNAETRVVFVRAEFALNLVGGHSIMAENFRQYFEFNGHGDFRLEGNSEFVFKTKTDSLGNYKIELPIGKYIAFARAKGYAVEFYKNQSNIFSADIILIPSPTMPPMEPTYDFTLSPLPPVVLGGIKGSVSDSVKDIAIPARVVAFRDGWRIKDDHRISRVYVTDTDSLGKFEFNELLPGTYFVMALPLGNYAPSFYTSFDTVNNRWKRASKIVINGNSVDNINIYVKPFGASANGYTGIIGNINLSIGNKQDNSSKAGAFVFAMRDGEIAGYAITDGMGNYRIDGLAPGKYNVSVDKAGYDESASKEVNVSYDLMGNPVNGDVSFTINSVLSVSVTSTVQPKNYLLEQNYPNPFNPNTTIKYSLPSNSTVSLKVYNLIGQEVATLINTFQTSGEYTVTFNASTLSSGVYFYRLDAGQFNVVKKMLLLK
ncbi:MAG: carboxypeptidase regulatory-like domain-containing protein [Bacteroidota bacterium]|nr:carboxypeptidase regulatory-like domain-containing protein [Bacteroidota bacterium]